MRCRQGEGDAAGIRLQGEKVVLLNPTDLTTVGPLGDVTHDLLLKLGMNVEMVAADWGTWLSVAYPASRWKRVAGRSCTPGRPRRFASLRSSTARFAAWVPPRSSVGTA